MAICCAGTSDIPVCEEAAVTLDVMGVPVVRVYDVGVAGIHRLLARRRDLDGARAVIVVAGMEGALASVVGGLVGKPVIAVPTSVGYGASLGGLAPLLTMLNSCAPNVTVVNIDNGFGAAFVAALIARGVDSTMNDALLLEPVGGIAGDMFLAAALDLGVDRAALEAALATLPRGRLPAGAVAPRRRAPSTGTHVDVVVEGEQPQARGLREILELIDRSELSPRAPRPRARALFERIGRAEAKVHGIPLEEVHFHEVGAVDSIVDLCGAAVVLDLLGWPRVFSRAAGAGARDRADGARAHARPAAGGAGAPDREAGPPRRAARRGGDAHRRRHPGRAVRGGPAAGLHARPHRLRPRARGAGRTGPTSCA